MRKNANKKKQLIYRKDGPIPPPIKIGGGPSGHLYGLFHIPMENL